jgi:hypothetical protein
VLGLLLTDIALPGQDPDVASWLVTALEVVAAAVAAATLVSRRGTSAKLRVFWGSVAAVALVMAVNKQVDVQTRLTREARRAFSPAEWAELRPIAVLLVVTGLTVVGLTVLGLLVWASAGGVAERVAGAGVAALLSFALLRTVAIGGAAVEQGRFGHGEMLPLEALGAVLIIAGAVIRWGVDRARQNRDAAHPAQASSVPM